MTNKDALASATDNDAGLITHAAAIDAENIYRQRVGLPTRGRQEDLFRTIDGDPILVNGNMIYFIDYTTHAELITTRDKWTVVNIELVKIR